MFHVNCTYFPLFQYKIVTYTLLIVSRETFSIYYAQEHDHFRIN